MKDYIPDTKTIVAILIIVVGFAVIVFAHLTDAIHNRIFDLMFLVGTYYFGSSQQASKQSDTISDMATKK